MWTSPYRSCARHSLISINFSFFISLYPFLPLSFYFHPPVPLCVSHFLAFSPCLSRSLSHPPHMRDGTTTRCNSLQQTATYSSTLQYSATHCNILQHTAPHCTSLNLTATHCNTLQHTCMHVHIYVCVCVCEHVRVYMYFYAYIYVCELMYKVVCMVVNSMYGLWHEAHTCYASLICIYHATSLKASWRTSEWVMAHIWMSHGTHMNESTPMHLSCHFSQ